MVSWRDAHPDVEVECIEADRSVLLAGLDTGEIDIAILMGAVSYGEYRCEPFWSERILAALSAAHPLAERTVVLWTDLRRERILLPAAEPTPFRSRSPARGGLGDLHSGDEWIAGLTAAMLAASRRQDEQATAPEP